MLRDSQPWQSLLKLNECFLEFNDFFLSPGNRHHYSKSRWPDRYSCRGDAGEQDSFRKPADPRPLRHKHTNNEASCTMKREKLFFFSSLNYHNLFCPFSTCNFNVKPAVNRSKVNLFLPPDALCWCSNHHEAFQGETRCYWKQSLQSLNFCCQLKKCNMGQLSVVIFRSHSEAHWQTLN